MEESSPFYRVQVMHESKVINMFMCLSGQSTERTRRGTLSTALHEVKNRKLAWRGSTSADSR